jgi:hypothetical protein
MRHNFQVPLHDWKTDVWCAITVTQIAEPTLFRTLLFNEQKGAILSICCDDKF